MTFLQKMVMAVLPRKLAGKVEAESRDWMLQCPACEREMSIWDIGGIRYKATNKVKLMSWCSRCGKYKWQRLYRKSAEPKSPPGIRE
jgi:rRNA maturation endonuclease Nob1